MKNFFYRVRENDSVIKVSRRFSVPFYKLIKDNNLYSEIEEGDILYIEKTDKRVYVVKPSDSIESISESFGVPTEKIRAENGISFVFYGLIIFL